MIRRSVLILLLSLVLAVPVNAVPAQFSALVTAVADGVTITVLTPDKRQVKIRLYGIDCPERWQAFGDRAKQATSDAVFGKTVTVQPKDTDRYGRTAAVVLMPGGKSLNEHLIREGLARVYQDCTQEDICASLRKLETGAKAQKRGMWEDKTPAPQPGWTIFPGGGGPSAPGSAPK